MPAVGADVVGRRQSPHQRISYINLSGLVRRTVCWCTRAHPSTVSERCHYSDYTSQISLRQFYANRVARASTVGNTTSRLSLSNDEWIGVRAQMKCMRKSKHTIAKQ